MGGRSHPEHSATISAANRLEPQASCSGQTGSAAGDVPVRLSACRFPGVLATSLSAGLQLLLVFFGVVLIVLCCIATYQVRHASQRDQAGVRKDSVRLIALGAVLIAVGLVWAAATAALPTATKLLLAGAVFVIFGGVSATSAVGPESKRVVIAGAAVLALALAVMGFLVGAYQEFVR